jgi:NTE family protein
MAFFDNLRGIKGIHRCRVQLPYDDMQAGCERRCRNPPKQPKEAHGEAIERWRLEVPGPKLIELALQGGGAHGAFSWGVLDRLLEDDRVQIEAICGTSAGAMNGVVLADGLDRGGKEGAREALRRFWRGVSRAALFSPLQRTPLDRLLGSWRLDHSPGYLMFDMLSRLLSPYLLNPFNINPLRDLIDTLVDFEHVRHAEGIKLFVAATNVRTGKLKVFRRQEMTADMVMASACLPFVYQAVEIDGEAYWDGGYMGNPTLLPLVEDCDSRDLVIVQINPIFREDIPRQGVDILNRLNEITFNASLIKEIRSIAYLKKLIEVQGLEQERFKDALFHRISADEELRPLSVSSKFNAEWAFLEHLHDVGYRTTSAWLDENYSALGKRSTMDIEKVYF